MLFGGANPDDEFDVEDAVKGLSVKSDRIETVFSGSIHFDVMYAWWSLTAKGMKLIICKIADSGFRLTGRDLRLCG